MARADLHTHTQFSRFASDKLLQALKLYESYTEPQHILQQGQRRGQTFFTITDHNQIEGVMQLISLAPRQTFTGVESTVYFPGEECKIHVLVYGFTAEEFQQFDRLRQDVYQFREYLRERRLAYSVAHPLLKLGKVLTMEHLEKLVLLFDVFEGINGSQSRRQNLTWVNYVRSLTPEKIDRLHQKHHIEPMSADPWVKGLTGGSDDHSGLFIGETFTECAAETPAEFLAQIQAKRSQCCGEHSTYKSMALTVLKVSYEGARQQPGSQLAHPLARNLAANIFEGKPLNMASRVQLGALSAVNRVKPAAGRTLLLDAAHRLANIHARSGGLWKDVLYENLSELADDLLRSYLQEVASPNRRHKFSTLLRHSLYPLTSLLLSGLFYGALGVMNASQPLIEVCRAASGDLAGNLPRRALWFNDDEMTCTLLPANPEYEVTLVSCSAQPMPLGFTQRINLPLLMEVPIPGAAEQRLKVPSPLHSIKLLLEQPPDEIYISSPGPVGMLGLALAKLLRVPCNGVVENGCNQPEAAHLYPPGYRRWFLEQMSEVFSPEVRRGEDSLVGMALVRP